MKRHGNLWDKIVNKDNLYKAYLKARKGKGWQRKVRVVNKNPDKIASAEGWMKHATTHNLAVSLRINELKECIKNERYSEAS